ncbi:hypothetical protein HOLleu_25424 [Holothuria leucospilota]|uniref:Uncharacterized protein n=1 Tax=Holothuria leucospilota TaxID=206669 RepID=A0A9Q1H1U6_HOLLE|nr:hypothetical protein HOLleu_25424 [Holothuria leucospilota]
MTAITTKNTGNIHQVSPTVLSSDLFTPLREPRVTLPTIGVHVRDIPPQGTQPWGGCLTTYGGTGGLPFLGSYRVRDLHFGRSHRHFGSGLSYHPTTTQPYRLTHLKLSDCRTNDQRLTASLKADGVSSTWQREAWPGHHPYFSHRSIFEVFPTGVSSGSDEKDPKEHSNKVQEKLYQQTLYRDSFEKEISNPPSTEASRVPRMSIYPPNNPYTLNDKFAHIIRNHETDTEKTMHDVPPCDTMRTNKGDEEEDEDDESNEEVEENEEENIDSGHKKFDDTSQCYDEIEQYKCKIKESVKALLDKLSRQRKERERLGYPPLPQVSPLERKNTSPDPPPPPPPPPQNYLPPCLMSSSNPRSSKTSPDTGKIGLDKKLPSNNSVRKLTFASGSPVSGVGPCWPPSTSNVVDNIRGSQLLERRELSEFPEAYLSTLEPRPTVVEGTFIRDNVKPLHPKSPSLPIKPERYSDYCYLPTVPLKEGLTPISPAFLDKFQTAVPDYQRPSTSKEGAAILRRPNGDILYLPPVPLSDCLTPSGSKIPHKLGLRFKTEAHRRFHAMHQEEVPDLRSTKNWGKKYFFFDYHSSALRG